MSDLFSIGRKKSANTGSKEFNPKESGSLKLHIGCGPRILKGWVNIDLAFEPYENYMQYYTMNFTDLN